jgi:5'-nucleotidase
LRVVVRLPRPVAAVLLAALVALPLVGAQPVGAAAPKRLTILVTNDDGVAAPGIDLLVQRLRKLKNVRVVVVAPAENKSGSGDQTTPGELTVTRTTTASGIKARAVDGFPADTVIWALDHGVKPDLVVSGINQGQNIGPAIAVSGTVGAAKTAVRNGIPALAVSQGIAEPPDYPAGVRLAVDWVKQHRKELTGKRPDVELANLNVPTCATGEVRGVVDVPPATEGDILGPSDCASTLTDPTDDVQAFANGYAPLSIVPAD